MPFPRTILPKFVSPFRTPDPLASTGQSGKVQLRDAIMMGREWDESFGPLRVGTPDVDALLAFIEANKAATFTIQHLISPGSGLAPHGVGGGTPLVNGATQTGASLITDGWSFGVTDVVKAGDVIRVSGLDPLFRITADTDSDGSGNATLTISPPIVAGSSPAENAPIARASCTLTVFIASPPNLPAVPPGYILSGLSLTFRESL